MKNAILAAAVAALSVLATSSQAAVIGLQREGGLTQQVYQLTNGNFLALFGFDNREKANPGKGAVTISSASDITSGFAGGSRVVRYYNGTNPVNPGKKEFDALVFGFTVADNARLFGSIWVEWTGGQLVYRQPRGGTTSVSATATLPGDPFAVTPVPVPAALPLLVAALGCLGLVARRRARA